MRVVCFGLTMAVLAFAADIQEGKSLFEQKKYNEAAQIFRDAVAAEPDNTEANYYLGETLAKLEQYKEAEPFLEKAATDKPEARIALGHSYLMQDRLKEAAETLDSAQEGLDTAVKGLDQTIPEQKETAGMYQKEQGEVHHYRGMVYLKENKFDDAYKELSQAAELNPQDAYAYYYLGMASSRIKRPDQMVKNFQIFLQLAPEAPEAPKVKSLLKSLK
jgi:tetratricopeptide (TPR) repeat protein